MATKPEKIIYKNQKKILQKILKEIKLLLDGIDCKTYLIGSSITGEFGKYKLKYGDHKGSDIDLIIFIAEKAIPTNWKYLNTEKSWWKLYRLGSIEINGELHKIDAMVVKKDMEEYAKKRIKELWKPLIVK